jgi:hypothetical protein|tara:strand:- start:124 stop:474 length:351 start_codon:yes stop_codon:yes gene_type:complete
MFLEVEPSSNCQESVGKMYNVISQSRKISSLQYEKDGKDVLVSITGWDGENETPCPAYACQIEESGDGVALLIYGGKGGVRMKTADDNSEWDANNANQWSESHLVYPRNSKVTYQD